MCARGGDEGSEVGGLADEVGGGNEGDLGEFGFDGADRDFSAVSFCGVVGGERCGGGAELTGQCRGGALLRLECEPNL